MQSELSKTKQTVVNAKQTVSNKTNSHQYKTNNLKQNDQSPM